MVSLQNVITVVRDDAATDSVPACKTAGPGTDYFGLRIASVFVILVGSGLGAIVPVWLARTSKIHVPPSFFFTVKYFGSGVILATAWMHLLSPASDSLRDPCLANVLPDYDWAMGIGLMTVMVMFLIEIIVSQFDFGHDHGSGGSSSSSSSSSRKEREEEPDQAASRTGSSDPSSAIITQRRRSNDIESKASNSGNGGGDSGGGGGGGGDSSSNSSSSSNNATPPGDPSSCAALASGGGPFDDLPGGETHLCHRHEHVEGDSYADFGAQMTALFILEFGVIFHSIFIGLTLAVSDNFVILFVVLVFHQTFEGLGLGARLATAAWPAAGGRRWTPYALGLLYAVSTPLSIAVGIAVRESLTLDSATSLVINGIFDAVSGGILMYTGLVELLAHEFMFNPDMRRAGLRTQLAAYACVAAGVALMSLLAKWA